ncbi:glycosyltransferase family 2 protein [Acinetobacter indicus]|uniref:glycosyltransferase family 2 protein n=1 Tax=Acinetobacter indicus TaxID=756892 RepID=UPI000CEC7924|nr:glycosyltransferase [Acinetobacter indicus]
MLFTVIIPFWNRAVEVSCLLKSLDKQALSNNIILQVIISDSQSCKEIYPILQNSISDYKNLLIEHVHTLNILSKKRNFAIDLAKGEFLIFLDDDCIPADNFLNNCIKYTETMQPKDVVCGEVRFLEEKVESSNYFRYRDSKHPHPNSEIQNMLNQWNFVAMNYIIRKQDIIDSGVYYDERFLGYGAEDHDYAYRLLKNNFRIIQGVQKIWHYEISGDIMTYTKKIFNCSKGGMMILENIHPELKNEFSKKKKLINFIFNNKFFGIFLFNLFFNTIIVNKIKKILVENDQNKKFYLKTLYRYVIVAAYLQGLHERKEVDYEQFKNSWYD